MRQWSEEASKNSPPLKLQDPQLPVSLFNSRRLALLIVDEVEEVEIVDVAEVMEDREVELEFLERVNRLLALSLAQATQ